MHSIAAAKTDVFTPFLYFSVVKKKSGENGKALETLGRSNIFSNYIVITQKIGMKQKLQFYTYEEAQRDDFFDDNDGKLGLSTILRQSNPSWMYL